MMTLLREKTGLVLWVVIFAFIGLIVVEWGADYSGPSQSDAGTIIGVVNGEEIGLQDFQGALRQLAQHPHGRVGVLRNGVVVVLGVALEHAARRHGHRPRHAARRLEALHEGVLALPVVLVRRARRPVRVLPRGGARGGVTLDDVDIRRRYGG